jgi:hypothetical protein
MIKKVQILHMQRHISQPRLPLTVLFQQVGDRLRTYRIQKIEHMKIAELPGHIAGPGIE